jgi:hypothetical protein
LRGWREVSTIAMLKNLNQEDISMNFDIKRAMTREFNVGGKEQRIRYGVGIGMLLVSVFLANIPLLLMGVVLVATAKLQWCPVYSGLSKSSVEAGDEPPVASHH